MIFNCKLNGLPCVLDIPDEEFAALKGLSEPNDFNQKDAAKFCRVSVTTFHKWGIPKNANGRYSVAVLKERMDSKSPKQPKTKFTKKK